MSTAVAERATPRDVSPAAQARQRMEAFLLQVEKRLPQVEILLEESGVNPKRFLETCRRALMKDPELVNCNPASFVQSALNSASDGLPPDGRKAAFVRYAREVQYVPMYQGLLDVAYRSGNFQSIEAHTVYRGDEFDFALGDKPFIHHKPMGESDEIIAAYAIAKTVNGGVFREVMNKRELAKVRAISRAKKGPNVDWPGEMARKAPLRRMWKFLPKTPAMERVAEHDDATYDHTVPLPPANDGPKLAPGFASPALAAPEDKPEAEEETEAYEASEDQTADEADYDDYDRRPIEEILEGDGVPDFDADEPPASQAEQEGEGASPSPPAEADEDMDPGEFAAWATDRLERIETSEDLDAFLSSPEATRGITKLERDDPRAARDLDRFAKLRRREIESAEAKQS